MNFAVLMAVYFRDDPIIFNKALKSVFENTLQPNTFLLVADGPLTTELNDVINLYSNFDYFKVVRLEKNSGLFHALNYGISIIEDEVIIRADSDDINDAERFDYLMKNILNFDIVGSTIREVDLDGEPLHLRIPPMKHDLIVKTLPYRNPLNHMSVAFRRDIAIRAGLYPNIYLREDYGFWISCASVGARFCNLPLVLVDATAGPGLIKRRGGFKYALGEVRLQVHLFKSGQSKIHYCIIFGFFRFFVFMLPGFIRSLVYKKLLRKDL